MVSFVSLKSTPTYSDTDVLHKLLKDFSYGIVTCASESAIVASISRYESDLFEVKDLRGH